jgi:hypothetical protein
MNGEKLILDIGPYDLLKDRMAGNMRLLQNRLLATAMDYGFYIDSKVNDTAFMRAETMLCIV